MCTMDISSYGTCFLHIERYTCTSNAIAIRSVNPLYKSFTSSTHLFFQFFLHSINKLELRLWREEVRNLSGVMPWPRRSAFKVINVFLQCFRSSFLVPAIRPLTDEMISLIMQIQQRSNKTTGRSNISLVVSHATKRFEFVRCCQTNFLRCQY